MDLPPLPGSQARAFSLVANENVTFKELASVIEADPALTAAVLRAANSALSAPIGRIESAEQGLVRIGIERTRRIIAGAVLSGNLTNLRRANLDTDELWRHLVSCALLADVTAWGELRRSGAFTAGLLHDIGRLAMAHLQPEAYAEVVTLVRQDGVDNIEAEARIFGTDHVAVAVDVARAWNIPEDIVEAMGDHHLGALGAMSWVVWNARRVSWSLGIGDGLDAPDGVTLDPASEDAEIVAAVGGTEKFFESVAWYTGAITGAVAA
jgi:putative nucleotidyltransferase with HDIG domain